MDKIKKRIKTASYPCEVCGIETPTKKLQRVIETAEPFHDEGIIRDNKLKEYKRVTKKVVHDELLCPKCVKYTKL